MEEHHGAWLTQFSGRSLHDPEPQRWALRRDGGDFDQLTGASITSRAVCDALQRALRFAAANPGLFAGDQNE
jgi:electron transport complex protein RnfG